MSNIAKGYKTIQQTREWRQLHDLLLVKKNFVKSIINGTTMIRQRMKAQQALDQLMAIFDIEIQPVILAA